MMWTTSAPSKRSRKFTNSLEAISSSAASTRVLTPKYHARGAAVDPRLVDRDDGIAHAGDQVDKVAVAMRLGQPHRVANFGLKALLLQDAAAPRARLRWSEKDRDLWYCARCRCAAAARMRPRQHRECLRDSDARRTSQNSARCSGGNSGGTEVLTGNSFSVATA